MGNKYDLTQIKGLGERMAHKIITHLGGEEELREVIENFQVDRLANIDGISQKKAVEIVNGLLGNPTQQFLKTDRSEELYNEIISKILDFSQTDHGKNRILLLNPSKDPEIILSRLNFVDNAKKKVSKLPIEKVSRLLKNLHLPRPMTPIFDPSKAILVENNEDRNYLIEEGLNRYCPIISNIESLEFHEYEMVIYTYSDGHIELDDSDNVIMVSIESDLIEIVPDMVLDYFKNNKDIFNQVRKLRKLLGKETVLDEVMEIITQLEQYKSQEFDLEYIVKCAKNEGDMAIKNAVKNVDLKGDEVLDLLNKEMPAKIEKILKEIISKVRAKIKAESGIDFDPFLPNYPLEIDQKELDRVKKRELRERLRKEFDIKVEAARRLRYLRERAETEIKEALDFDYEFALGCFAHYYKLKAPEIADEFRFEKAAHLNLLLENPAEVQRIDYSLAYPENVVLLTGANSGGKTTLLETMAQISIMAQLGLPVSAEKARVKLLDEIYFFSKKRSLDAGALESFLQTFIPVVIKESEKLILLDELEAITELEAAVKIISTFIDFIKDSNSYAIIVTHMARELIKYTPVRVDGIEATGLDQNYNLIVDRTPKINYLARSTPELILRMIYNKSQGDLKEVYGKMLEKF